METMILFFQQVLNQHI